MVGPLLFLFGYRRLRVDRGYAGELMNICRAGGYVYRNFTFTGDYATFDCSLKVAKSLTEACRARGIPVVTGEPRGLPGLLLRYRRRFGILAGALAFCAIVFWSGRVIWSIEVDGNRVLSDRQVIEHLRLCGLEVGVSIGSLDTAAVENRALIASDEISWITVNLIGTVAHVEIREVSAELREESYGAANLVAERAGQIEWFEDVRGNVAVKIGDYVGEGELLVGGLYDLPQGGYRYTCAKGKVYARTKREFSAEVPLIYEKKAYTGRVKTEKYLIFFKKEVKFFGNTGNSYGTCDTIDTVEYWELPGGVSLPVGVRTVRHLEYETVSAERSEESAIELAYYRLRCQMESAVPEGTLVRKNLEGIMTAEGYVLRCKAEYIEDIAKPQEILLD